MSVKKKKKGNRKGGSHNKKHSGAPRAVRQHTASASKPAECKPELTLVLEREPIVSDEVDNPAMVEVVDARVEFAERAEVDKREIARRRGYALARAFGRESGVLVTSLVERCALIASVILMIAAATVAIWIVSGNRMREVSYGNDNAFFVWHESKEDASGTLHFTPHGRVEVEYSEGDVILRYENGDLYRGDAVDFIPNGSGAMIYANGDSVEGWFSDGKPHGLAICRLRDGGSYEGDYVYGVKSGKGKFTFADGSVYIGEVKNDRIDGDGEMRFASWDLCIGSFTDGVAQGSVSYVYASGDVYEGDFVAGRAHGNGKMYYANGDLYVGEFANNEISGFGRYTWADGTSYVGEFANGSAK